MTQRLRPFQLAGRDAVEADWARGVRRTALAHCTGSGKTTTGSDIVGRWLDRHPGRRALWVAHRIELIEQGAKRLRRHLPGRPVGVVMAGRNQTLPRVLVGSVQTLASDRRRRMLRDVGLIVIDECHRAAAPSYVSLLQHFGAYDGDAVALGLTATMSRGDDRALGDVWESVPHTYPIATALDDGWLVPPAGISVRVDDLDLRRVAKSRGDYQDGALGEAIEGSLAPKRIAEAYREHAAQRRGVVFAPTVHSAGVIRDALRAEGFAAELVHAGTPATERESAVAGVLSGRVQVLCNVGVFTEGTDLPPLSVCVIARPTMHSGLYVQMAGRVLRLWCPVHGDGSIELNAHTPCCGAMKRDALILDVVGAARRHSLSARVELFGAQVADELESDPDAEPAELEVNDLETGTGEPVETEYVDGTLRYEIIDLFAASSSHWRTTYGGVWYLEAGERYIIILPAPAEIGGFDVIAMHRYVMGTGRWVKRGAVGLAEAMRAAEHDVTPRERNTARRARAWRAGEASTEQVRAAVTMGLAADGTAGQVSDRIVTDMASRRIDPHIPGYVSRKGIRS